jgi:CheY-like chemotaxis protein
MRRQNVALRELDVIERQTRHLTRLVDNLLDLSRVANGKVELRKRRVELADVFEAAIEMTSDVLERREHILTLNLPSEGLPIEADPDRLAQVFSNILMNAAKYSDPGSRIQVDAKQVGDCARLIVRDFGMGLSPKLRSRIFELFVQSPGALDRSAGGLGVGLAIARGLVQMHGGKITANSEGVGKGSEFVVDLPIAKHATAPATVPETTTAFRARPKNTEDRVLVVDDNQDAAELYATVLSRAGYQVKTAFDAPSAFTTARQFMPHICVLDIGLPAMNGYEVGTRMRECIRRDMRLIAVTGYGQASDKIRSAAAGFESHLTKPVDVDALLAALDGRPLLNAALEDRVRDGRALNPSSLRRNRRRGAKTPRFRKRMRSA